MWKKLQITEMSFLKLSKNFGGHLRCFSQNLENKIRIKMWQVMTLPENNWVKFELLWSIALERTEL